LIDQNVIHRDGVGVTSERKTLVGTDASSLEITALDADIYILANRIIDAGDGLPGELALAGVSDVHSGITDADTDVSAESGLTAEV
jgi:hypothetical protein